MEAFLISAGVVALAEIGDKTQLLALVLAARYRRPWPIIAGIVVATLANHSIAGAIGAWVMRELGPEVLRWGLALSFFGMAIWTLVPDKLDAEAAAAPRRFGVFGTTVVSFFLAEMGDKTQVATMALAARYASFYWVVAGTTTGLLLADVPAVLLGERLAGRLPIRAVHALAASIFVVLGILVLLNGARTLIE
jgi:putative Ca2+/H+ antiporter (TMEM165/GDT1 family)